MQALPCPAWHGKAWNGGCGIAGWQPRRQPASPTPVADPGNLRAPMDVALTVDGRQLVVADPGAPSIKLFTVDPNSNGILEPGEPAFDLTFASIGYGPGQLLTPVGGGTGQGGCEPLRRRAAGAGSPGSRSCSPGLLCRRVAQPPLLQGRHGVVPNLSTWQALQRATRFGVGGIISLLQLAERAASSLRLQMGVAAGADGIYVTDFPTGRVAKFNLTGGFVWQVGQTGPSDEEVSGRAPTPAPAPGMLGGVASATPPGHTPAACSSPTATPATPLLLCAQFDGPKGCAVGRNVLINATLFPEVLYVVGWLLPLRGGRGRSRSNWTWAQPPGSLALRGSAMLKCRKAQDGSSGTAAAFLPALCVVSPPPIRALARSSL